MPSARWRAALRLAGLAALFVGCLPLHLGAKLLFGRSAWPPRFLAAAGWIVGARVRVEGSPVAAHTLLIANHTSWLDILILAGATGCAFVSKDNLGHAFIHWLADQNHTLYIKRSQRRGVAEQAEAIAAALALPQPLALFPEGTTGPGTHLLPFRSALLSAVAPTPPGVAVRPVAIDYGAAASEIGWYEESGKDNVPRVMGRRGTLAVTIRLLDLLAGSGDRKHIAEQARSAIAAALAASSSPPTRL